MQFTDLLVGVLTEFPESPDGCHSDRLREAKRNTDYETQHGANRRRSGRVGGDTGGFKTRPRPFDERLRNGRLRPHDCRDSDDDAPFLSYRSHTTMYSF